MRPGLYLYLLPVIPQARAVIWEGRGKDGKRLRDRIPASLIASINETRMTIKLVNGSIIQVTGGDNYESILGSNPLGAVLSEYQSMNPLAWELFLRAILAENGGWAIFISTPRGHNHLYQLVQQNKDNPEWDVTIKTVEDTKLEDGSPAVPMAMVEAERAAGMEESLVLQEFFCSFEAAIQGAFFREQLEAMRAEGRMEPFDIDPMINVHTGWDLGVRDATSIFLMQRVKGTYRLIYHIEESNRSLEYFVFKLEEIRKELGFRSYGHHFVPHDIAVREFGTGKSRLSQAQAMGIQLRPVTNIGGKQIRVMEGISIIRHCMKTMWINPKTCAHGLKALQEYRSLYDDKKKISTPYHDWSSHASSALATLLIGHMDAYDNKNLLKLRDYASYIPCG